MPPSRFSASCKSRTTLAVITIGLLTMCRMSGLQAQEIGTNSSFSDKIEYEDSKSAIAGAVSQTEDVLKENLILQEQVRSISAALVDAKQHADSFSAENRELKTRVEALGLNAVGNSRSKLEQRLVKAVSDLNATQASAADYKRALAGLSEAVLSLLKTAKDVSPDARVAVEAELRNVSQKLGETTDSAEPAQPAATSMSNSRVISVKPDLGLLVGNIGSVDGVKVGMPFRVYEGQQVVALVRVVDVREKIFGALVQEKLSDKIPVKVGHRLKVAAE